MLRMCVLGMLAGSRSAQAAMFDGSARFALLHVGCVDTRGVVCGR